MSMAIAIVQFEKEHNSVLFSHNRMIVSRLQDDDLSFT